MPKKRPDDIILKTMTDNQTWNDCPKCRKIWRDRISTPGIIHKTQYCDDCKQAMHDEVYGHMHERKPK